MNRKSGKGEALSTPTERFKKVHSDKLQKDSLHSQRFLKDMQRHLAVRMPAWKWPRRADCWHVRCSELG
jgi:hypothetical protein